MPQPSAADPPGYQAAIDYLMGRINYEHLTAVPYAERSYKLGRMRDLLRRLDDPQAAAPIIHIAGTKGKGSCAEMISRVLQAAGLNVGVYSSPHLERLEERFAVNGRPCTADDVVALVEQCRGPVERMDREYAAMPAAEIGPTYFELTTAMALLHFRAAGVDAVILETGMGGRLDSTNVCTPVCSVITSISLDHTKQLGNTLRAIATEKAGIIKPGVPVISGVVEEEPREAIAERAAEVGAPLIQLARDFDYKYVCRNHLAASFPPPAAQMAFRWHEAEQWRRIEAIELGMAGSHQARNAAVALATVNFLQAYWPIPEDAIRRGMRAARLPARVEVLRTRPTVVLDAAHNPASIAALVEALDERFPSERRTLLFAASHDKDYVEMLRRVLPKFARVVFTRFTENPRAVAPERLLEVAQSITPGDYAFEPNPLTAWRQVQATLEADDLVCITGSFFIAAELRGELLRSCAMPAASGFGL